MEVESIGSDSRPLVMKPAHPTIDREGASPPAVLVEELTPAVEPWEAFRRVAPRLPRAAFLDSALVHATLGSYSYVTADPFSTLCARGRHVAVDGTALPPESDPLALLADRLSQWRLPALPELPPSRRAAAESRKTCQRQTGGTRTGGTRRAATSSGAFSAATEE